MLFLGSKKYPVATHFVDYISKHNGKFNGFTDFEITGFFFKVSSEAFPQGFDIFANVFIDPLFDEAYVVKEVESVNSEFERNIQSDSKRKEQVFREISRDGSLFHKFSTGNTNTLLHQTAIQGLNLREEVIKYFKDNYRVDNMKLVIYGPEGINVYKDLVEKTFGTVEKPLTLLKKEKKRKEAFDKENLGRVILYKTINKHQQLDISIKIPDIHKDLPSNLSLLFKILINKDGKGTLSDILKKQGYISSSIGSGVRRIYDGLSMFKIVGTLTNKGIKHLNDVISTIFNYINILKNKALDENIYNYYKKILTLRFQYKGKRERVMQFMKHMCIGIWKYQRKYLIAKHSLLSDYDADKITEFSKHLKLSNAIILVGNKSFSTNAVSNYGLFLHSFDISNVLKEQEPWYHTSYSQYKILNSLIKKSNKIPDYDVDILKTIEKPLPKRVSLIKRCTNDSQDQCIDEMKQDSEDLTPKELKNDDFIHSWYKVLHKN